MNLGSAIEKGYSHHAHHFTLPLAPMGVRPRDWTRAGSHSRRSQNLPRRKRGRTALYQSRLTMIRSNCSGQQSQISLSSKRCTKYSWAYIPRQQIGLCYSSLKGSNTNASAQWASPGRQSKFADALVRRGANKPIDPAAIFTMCVRSAGRCAHIRSLRVSGPALPVQTPSNLPMVWAKPKP